MGAGAKSEGADPRPLDVRHGGQDEAGHLHGVEGLLDEAHEAAGEALLAELVRGANEGHLGKGGAKEADGGYGDERLVKAEAHREKAGEVCEVGAAAADDERDEVLLRVRVDDRVEALPDHAERLFEKLGRARAAAEELPRVAPTHGDRAGDQRRAQLAVHAPAPLRAEPGAKGREGRQRGTSGVSRVDKTDHGTGSGTTSNCGEALRVSAARGRWAIGRSGARQVPSGRAVSAIPRLRRHSTWNSRSHWSHRSMVRGWNPSRTKSLRPHSEQRHAGQCQGPCGIWSGGGRGRGRGDVSGGRR